MHRIWFVNTMKSHITLPFLSLRYLWFLDIEIIRPWRQIEAVSKSLRWSSRLWKSVRSSLEPSQSASSRYRIPPSNPASIHLPMSTCKNFHFFKFSSIVLEQHQCRMNNSLTSDYVEILHTSFVSIEYPQASIAFFLKRTPIIHMNPLILLHEPEINKRWPGCSL